MKAIPRAFSGRELLFGRTLRTRGQGRQCSIALSEIANHKFNDVSPRPRDVQRQNIPSSSINSSPNEITLTYLENGRISNEDQNWLVRCDGSPVLVRRSWSHLNTRQREMLKRLFTHHRCKEICPVSGFKAQNVYGMNHPPFITEENVAELREHFQTLPTDIYVVAYPKCGTQWVLSILNCLKTGQGIPKEQENRVFPWPEKDGLKWVNQIDETPRIFKSHAPVRIAPWRWLHPKTKIIYITRNPKDTVVSFHKHAIQPGHPKWITAGEFCDYTGDLDSFFELFADGRLPFGDYFEHVAAWRQMAVEHPKQVLWVNFEDLKRNFIEEVARMGMFCDLRHDKETIEWVSTETTFLKMKEVYENTGHFRKGEIGDWKNHLSSSQCERLDTKFSQLLEPLGLRNQY